MTNEQADRVVNSIFDDIFDSVTKAESGGKPLMPAATTVLSLMKPGLAINSKDFRNPYTPGNLLGSKDAALNTARLVDAAPKMASLYTDSGKSISQIYEQILDGVCIPAQPPNPAVEKQLADAHSVLYRTIDVTDPDTGEVAHKEAESQLYRDYQDNQAAYYNARLAYVSAYLEAQKTASGKSTWPLVAPTLQLPVKSAYDRWRSAFADKVEQSIAIMNTSSQNALQKAFDKAKKLYEGYGIQLEEGGGGMSPTTQRSSLLPSDWHSVNSTSKWTTKDVYEGSSSSSSASEYKSYGGSAGFSLGIFSIGGGAGHSKTHRHMSSETSNLRFSYKYTLVTIRRPWMTYNLLGTKGWNLGNLFSKSKVSNGTKLNQLNSEMPLLPTGFVVAKDVRISANWSKSDYDFIKSQTSGGGGFGIGPFTIGGSYASSKTKESYASSFAGANIIAPGVQIIGWISQVVPFCPPA